MHHVRNDGPCVDPDCMIFALVLLPRNQVKDEQHLIWTTKVLLEECPVSNPSFVYLGNTF